VFDPAQGDRAFRTARQAGIVQDASRQVSMSFHNYMILLVFLFVTKLACSLQYLSHIA